MRKFLYSLTLASAQAVKGGVWFTAGAFLVGLVASASYDYASKKEAEKFNNQKQK